MDANASDEDASAKPWIHRFARVVSRKVGAHAKGRVKVKLMWLTTSIENVLFQCLGGTSFIFDIKELILYSFPSIN